jgi:hypothetical protein
MSVIRFTDTVIGIAIYYNLNIKRAEILTRTVLKEESCVTVNFLCMFIYSCSEGEG